MVGSRRVHKIKADDLFKRRLVVLGWAQVPGIDCGGTFTTVCRFQSIRMTLAIAADLDYGMLMLDVETAFLRYFFVQELMKEGKATIHFLKTEQQLVDLRTKRLKTHRHRFLIKLINEFRA